MTHNKPCNTCIFRNNPDAVKHLSKARIRQIVETVLRDVPFECHKHLTDGAERQQCIGALDFLFKTLPTKAPYYRTTRFAHTLLDYQPNTTDDIYDNIQEMIKGQN